MEIIESPIYFDTNVFIYSIEGHEKYYDVLTRLFSIIRQNNAHIVTSELSLAECLVKPAKDNNIKAIEQFKQHIQNNKYMSVKSVSRNILITSATVRGQLGLKLPDAIHMATAIEQKCKTFVTNDKKLKIPENMQGLYLHDF